MARPHVLWVLVAATARAKRSNPPQKPLVARTYTTATVDALGAEAAADVRVAFDGGCRTLAGDECAGPTPRTNGTEPVTLVLIKATRDCGANGLWHLLNRCVTAAARAAAQRRAALAFVAHDGEPPEDPCRLAPLAERWRPFLEALFADGVYASLACYRRARPSARTYREVAVVAATPASQTVPENFRDVGFAAFGVPPPTDAVGAPRTVLHLRREDREGTLRAHRTLRNASVLEAAFRRAGFRVDHCCDFRAPDERAPPPVERPQRPWRVRQLRRQDRPGRDRRVHPEAPEAPQDDARRRGHGQEGSPAGASSGTPGGTRSTWTASRKSATGRSPRSRRRSRPRRRPEVALAYDRALILPTPSPRITFSS
ncbi:unnamed protein product, partial [Pelagomonas calceolata]